MFNNNQIVPTENTSSFLDKIVYFLEYMIALVIGFGLFTFLWFFIAGKMEGLGIVMFVIWLFIVLSFDGTVAPLVYKDVKKLQARGINTRNTAWAWAIIVFAYPLVGLSWYLANRRADFKKQIPNVPPENQPQ